MFALNNPTTFKYYTLFLIIYGLILAGGLALKLYLNSLNKRDKSLILKRKVLKGLISVFLQGSIYGLILLGARYIKMQLVSMEFLHILNLGIFTGATAYYLYRLKYGYKK